MDSTSGSLRDSEPNSPASPSSPDAISSPVLGISGFTPPAALSAALSTLKFSPAIQHKEPPSRKWSSSLLVPKTEQYSSDALISMEFSWIETPSAVSLEKEILQIATLQFNNLDVIANQETIVELVDFVKRIALERSRKSAHSQPSSDHRLNKTPNEQVASNQHISRTEITFDFHRLNILLLRAVSQKQVNIGQKVATATLSGARIQATIGSIIEIQGSLGGLQVLDLITENTRHPKIISIGYDPLSVQPLDLLNQLEEEMYKPTTSNAVSKPQYALTFTVIREDSTENKSQISNSKAFKEESGNKHKGYLDVNVRMASLCYTHSPRLLHELSSCATEFKTYMRSLANSIKSAATEVAIGIVSKRTGSISASLHGHNLDTSMFRSRFESTDDIMDDSIFVNDVSDDDVSVDLKLDVVLQTPVVAFPSSPHSADVLIAHLGRITIQKGTLKTDKLSVEINDLNHENMVVVEVRDMNMHFVNIEEKDVAGMSIKDLYACDEKNPLIVHNTILEVVISSDTIDIETEVDGMFCDSEQKQVEIRGKVVSPLRIVMSKNQFRHILKVLGNLTFSEDATPSAFIERSSVSKTKDGYIQFPNENKSPIQSQSHQQSSLKVSFELPDLITELRGDLTQREEGIVSLMFQDFILVYSQENAFVSSLQMTLQSLLMEDLRSLDDSRHCYLMSSVDQSKSVTHTLLPKSNFISVSCPSLNEDGPTLTYPVSQSLPDKLCLQNMFDMSSHRKLSGGSHHRVRRKTEENYPTTPPPSPTLSCDNGQFSSEALVFIKVTFIDRNSPQFSTTYHKTNRFVDVDFNCLDVILNLQTWVMVLDFFDASDGETNSTGKTLKSGSVIRRHEPKAESFNSETKLKVKSLTIILNKPEYKLASANISNFVCNTSVFNVGYKVKGTLGSISVADLSPHGQLFPEKFITTGSEALHFDVFKYSNEVAETSFDISVKCQMCSVQYVHTQRFLTEITTFFRHFNEMQELIRKIRLTASGANIDSASSRGSRVKLDISAASPVIVIPQSSSLTDVLVADLGKITVCNTFLYVGTEGTIDYSKKQVSSVSDEGQQQAKKLKLSPEHNTMSGISNCLLDVINVELVDMDLYSAVQIPKSKKHGSMVSSPECRNLVFPSFIIMKQGLDLMQQKFMLQVQVERNLDSATSHEAPDWTIEGMVSSVYVTMDKKQYKLIYGILNQNLGEPLEEFSLDVEGEQFVLMEVDGKTWTTMAIHIDLVNVSLELVRHENVVNKPGDCSLAKFDFMKSRLSYEAFSDNSRDIDLVSNMIQVSDIRYKDAPVNNRPNVFTRILQSTNKEGNVGSTLQAEVHYRITHDFSRFTLIFNNMRIMGIFEFIEAVLEFLKISGPTSTPQDSQPKTNTSSKPAVKSSQASFEMNVNVTDTELVVVEDTSLWDSNAVIVKTTAVVSWRPDYLDKPLSCSLQNLEVFSCILGVEEDTALSIVDPFTVSVEIARKLKSPIIELESSDVEHILDVSALNLNLRLSYYDITMFLKIFDSLKKQTAFYTNNSAPASIPNSGYSQASISCLAALGFTENDCQRALDACSGNVNDAALWLTQNASPSMEICENNTYGTITEKKSVNLCCTEIRLNSFSLCIIDDCRDADVPVAEFNLTEFLFVQKFLSSPEGTGNFGFSADYYNRKLSGWEPVMEPWKCCLKWKIQPIQATPSKKLLCSISSGDTINVNITSPLLELFKSVKTNWTEEYMTLSKRGSKDGSEIHSPGCYRRRLPFMPFALKNNTGCKIYFATQITSAEKQSLDLESANTESNKYSMAWTEVPPDHLVPMPFESRSKIRHKDSHSMKLHQLIVQAEGWLPVAPVSVDRVGTYFRHAIPQRSHSASVYAERPPARLVFVVALEGSARKLITVQSALLVSNKMEDTIELKLENQNNIQNISLHIVPRETLSVPLHFVHAQMFARPVDRSVTFCNHSIAWQQVARPGEARGTIKQCNSIKKTNEFYRFLVLSKRRHFPPNKESSTSPNTFPVTVPPAHCIYFLPSLEVINLLPCDLHYHLKATRTSDFVKAGKRKCLHHLDICEQFSILFYLDSFKRGKDLLLSSSLRHFPSRIELYDTRDRLLVLNLKVVHLSGGALKLFISSPFWLVNKTGLPLVFKQEGASSEGAGQFEEHELARCMAPLLFSFSDREASSLANMRIGRSLHPDASPQWCTRFEMVKGIRVRRLHVSQREGRPDLVYNIGIDVCAGRGKYGDTHIVTLSPRYQLHNRASEKLEFCQLFATRDYLHCALSAMPKSSLAFHWPRIDLDNLLCVRQPGIVDCNWSGGFPIDNISSFYVNMRDGQGKSNFLRVEIIMQGATYFIVFTDADRLPPPFRIDNHSEVSITYYQTNVEQERLRTTIRPHSSLSYAFDEATLPPYITCCAPGGSAATYNMNIFREGSQLFYENFIYITFSGTFPSDNLTSTPSHTLSNKEYVLDVPYSNKVVINRREVGKRSQLWRMTSTGMLQHEGSSPPRDPHKPNASGNVKILVLDIADIGPQPGEYTPLVLRKPDPRRKHTQTWKFTDDGRLCCAYPNMYVQSKDGFKGLRRGTDVVLGPSQPVSFVTMDNGIPIEQAISRRKLRGGSGVLTVKVIPDGPTRVLEITDIKRQQIASLPMEWSAGNRSSQVSSPQPNGSIVEVEMSLALSKGFGLSIINHLSEELVYVWLHNIMVEYLKATAHHTLCGSVKDIHVDNQLRDAEKPVTLCVTQQSKSDDQRHLPALHFALQRICTPLANADIFKHLIVTVKNLNIQLEERLLLKLLQFAYHHQIHEEPEGINVCEGSNGQKTITESMAYEKRYYFSTLKLCLQQVKLSVLTSSNLQPDLLQVKKKAKLRLIRFEDATIELDSFLRVHPFETAELLIDSIVEHYKEELKNQAAKILGAVDFLGNPIGLVNDVTEGISKFIHEGSVGGLIKNVTHGLSDSAAKISGSLSDGLGIVAIDDKHQQMRKQIRQQGANSGNRHLVAGLKGLGIGILGGMTSVFTQTYEGAVQEGVQGFFSGLGKGLVGTVAKPAVGVLDFASGAASAMRDTSKGSSHVPLVRIRPPRTCVGAGNLLPRYSFQQALGQDFLYNMNNKDYSELFIAKEQIQSGGGEELHALVSSEQAYFLSSAAPTPASIVLAAPFADLCRCNYLRSEAGVLGEVRHYLQLVLKTDNAGGFVMVPSGDNKYPRRGSMEPLYKKPQVRCDSEEVAQKVALHINYAKSLYEERTYMVLSDQESDEEKE